MTNLFMYHILFLTFYSVVRDTTGNYANLVENARFSAKIPSVNALSNETWLISFHILCLEKFPYESRIEVMYVCLW